MNNYFGIGLDAKISLEFNNKRDEHPKKCRLAETPLGKHVGCLGTPQHSSTVPILGGIAGMGHWDAGKDCWAARMLGRDCWEGLSGHQEGSQG